MRRHVSPDLLAIQSAAKALCAKLRIIHDDPLYEGPSYERELADLEQALNPPHCEDMKRHE